MKLIKTLIVSVSLMGASTLMHAQSETPPENNLMLNQILAADTPINEQEEVDYFKQIITSDGLFRFLLTMERQVPDINKTAEYVVLFKKLNLANNLLGQLLDELKQNNRLLSQSTLTK